tara:strand:- start:549 stop:854 length:306 start_codon:yes stop_codon:yes gene_type:complete
MRYWEVQELLCFATGMNSEEADKFCNDDGDYDQLVYDKFEVGFDEFAKIAEALLLLAPIVESPLSGDKYHCFADIANQRAIIKTTEVEVRTYARTFIKCRN